MQSLVRKEANDAIDLLEVALLQRYETKQCPLNHTFVPGMYLREIIMEAGDKITSKIHRIRHPFFVLKGSANVWTDGIGWQLIKAPYFGITEPGTRRVLQIIERCHWITCHSTDIQPEDDSPEAVQRAIDAIEDEIIEKHENNLLKYESEDRIQAG